MSWTATVERYLREGRPVSGGKGDSTLKAQEQAQANFTNTLMKSFKTQFAQQSSILNFLTSKLQPIINNPQGFSPETEAAMRTQATEGTAKSFQQGQQALNEIEAARGGSQLPSGVDAQLRAEGANEAAAQNEQSQQAITLANEQQKESNFWNAINALGGNAAQFNPTGYAGAANSGSGVVGDLGTAYKNSQSSQLLGALGGIAGGVGTAVAGFAKPGCWIAAACFGGWDDPRTISVRAWLNTEFVKHWYGRIVMRLYMAVGERVAQVPILVKMLKPLFNLALKKATK